MGDTFRGALISAMLMGAFLFASTADAVQIKRVQTGDVYFDTDDTAQVVELQYAVNLAKTFVLIYPNSDTTTTSAVQNSLFTADFASSTEIIISRDGGTAGSTVRYYVVEFADGVNVWRGISSFAPGNPANPAYITKTVSLSPSLTDYTKAFALVNARSSMTGSTTDEMATIKATVTNNNTLTLTRYDSNSVTKAVNMSWQVVEFTKDANVQSGDAAIPNASLTNSPAVTLSPAVDPDDSILFFTSRAQTATAGVENYYKIRGEITNGTTLTFTRSNNAGNPDDIDIRWQLVELTDSVSALPTVSAVQGRGTNLSLAAGGEVASLSLASAVDPLRSFPVMSASGTTGTTATYEDDMAITPLMSGPKGIVLDTGNNYIWVANPYANTVSRYNAATGAKIGTDITVGTLPVAIAFLASTTPDTVWVANYGSNNVTRINATDGTVMETVTVGTNPIDISIDNSSANPGAVWTANYSATTNAQVTKITVDDTSPYASTAASYGNGTETYATAITWDSTNANMWVAFINATRIHRYVCATPANTTANRYNIMTNGGFTSMDFAPSGFGTRAYPQLWLSNVRNNYISLVNVTTVTAPTRINDYATELNPRGVAIEDDAGTSTDVVWVANYLSNSLIKIDPATGNTVTTSATGINPWSVVYDATASKIWISNVSDNSLMTFDKTTGTNLATYSLYSGGVNAMYATRNNTTPAATANILVPEFCPITIYGPNGGDIWYVGQTDAAITWVYSDRMLSGGSGTGGVHRVKLEISQDGTNWYQIPGAAALDVNNATGGLNNQGKFVWNPVPESIIGISNLIGTTLKVKVTDIEGSVDPAEFTDSSNANFTIRGTISGVYLTDTQGTVNDLTNPAGIYANDVRVHWAHAGIIGNVKIEMDTDNNGTYDLELKDSTLGTQDYWDWPITTNNVSTTLRIRVKERLTTDVPAGTDPTGLVESASSYFELRPTIQVVKPDTSSIWVRGQGQSPTPTNGVVRWCAKGTIGNVDIRLSTNGGSSYSPDTDKVVFNTAGTLVGSDTADCPAILGAPLGSHKEYKYDWTIPADTVLGTTEIIKIVKNGDTAENVKGLSGLFTLKATVQLDEPFTSTILKYQQAANIKWSSPGGGLGNVKLMYCNGYVANGCQNNPGDADWVQITDPASATNLAPSASPWGWNVQAVVGADIGILVADMTNPTLIWDNKGPYVVKAWFDVTEPHVSEVLRIGGNKTIVWADHGMGNSDVYICIDSDNDGDCDYNLVNSAAVVQGNDAQYDDWSPPAAGATVLKDDLPRCAGTCSIRVYKPGDDPIDQTGTFGKSPLFSIKGNITAAAITETAPYKIGDVVTVTWTSSPASNWTTVRLSYSNDGSTWTDFANSVTECSTTMPSFPSSCSWTVPNDANFLSSSASPTSRIRVQDDSDAANTVSISNFFAVKPTLTIGSLTGSLWDIGTPHDISWTRTGGTAIANVNIRYSLNGGTSYPYLIKNLSAGLSPYTWCVGKNDGCSGTTPGDNAHDPASVILANDQNTTVKILVEDATDTWASGGTYSFAPGGAANITIQKAYLDVKVGGLASGAVLYVGDANPSASSGPNSITWTTVGDSTSNVYLAYELSGYTFPVNNISGTGLTSDIGAYHVWGRPPETGIPDAIGDTVKVRVKSINSALYGDSGPFTIKGRIVLGSILPEFSAGVPTLIVGKSSTISYTKYGGIGNLEVKYIHKVGTNEYTTTVDAGYTGASPFTWSAVDAADSMLPTGNNVIDDGSAGTKTSKFVLSGVGQSGALQAIFTSDWFQVRGEIYTNTPSYQAGVIVEPQGGDVYAIGGANQYIKWKTRGDVGPVRVRLDFNEGKGFNGTIGDSDDFCWGTACADSKVRRPDTACGTPPCYAESVAYTIGDDGTGLEWIIPDMPSTKARIRVESLANDATLTNGMATYGTSSANFRIKGNVVVTTPNGAQTPHWKTGEQNKQISFTTTGNIGKVDVVICYDDTSPYTPTDCSTTLPIASNVDTIAGSNSVYWNIPNNFSTDHAVIRVAAQYDSTVADKSDAEFKVKPALTLSTPSGSSTQLEVGKPYTNAITWSAPLGSASNFDIFLSTNGGKGFDNTLGTSDDFPNVFPPDAANKGGRIAANVAAASLGIDWSLEDTAVYASLMTKEAVIRIQKTGDSEAYSDSSAYFYIKGQITDVCAKNNVTDPQCAGIPIDLPIDNIKYITWKYTGDLSTVTVQYATDADQPLPTWQTALQSDGVTPCTNVSVGTGGSGSCSWKIPNFPSPNVKVRVVNTANLDVIPSLTTASSGFNSIIGSITEVTVVADGNPLTTDMEVQGNGTATSKTIRWKPNGAISLFDIQYRVGGGNWSSAMTGVNGVAGTPDTNPDYKVWTWNNIPNAISNDVDFLVSDHNDPAKVYCASDDVACTPAGDSGYVIKGRLGIVSPLSTDTWTVGVAASPSIRWNKQGTIGDVKIEYSVSGNFGASDYTNGYVYTIESVYASGVDGNVDYNWTEPGVFTGGTVRKISDAGKIKITTVATGETQLTAISDPFKIRPSLNTISTPATGTIWYAADAGKIITWAAYSGTKIDGSSPQVAVKYNVGGGSYSTVTVTDANDLNLVNGTNDAVWASVGAWTGVADEKANDAKIKIEFVDYPSYNPLVLADPGFKIHPKITVSLVPDGSNTKLSVGGTYNNLVHWTYTGTKTTTVDIRYDTNGGGGGYPAIQEVILNPVPVANGSTGETWANVPSVIGSNVRIKVFDPDFTDAAGESPVFKVVGGITNVQPSAGANKTSDTTMNVTWNYTGGIGNFDVYYSPSSGVPGTSYAQVGSLASSSCSGGSCSFSWLDTEASNTDAVLNTGKVKITNALLGTDPLYVETEGASDFKRGAAVNNLTVFNGPYIPVGSTTSEIQWTKLKGAATTTQMKIEYTNNASAGTPAWFELTPGTDNDASFIWPGAGGVPGAAADLNADVKLRITQASPDNASVTLTSTETFVIRAGITVTEPTGVGTESWGLQSNQNIKFTKKGALGSVNIYYAPDGVTYELNPINTAGPIDISALADDTVYTWQWTNIPASTPLTSGYIGKIKVKAETPSAQKNANAQGISNGGFQVRGSITAVSPSGQNNLLVGLPYDIQWTPVGNILKYKVEYSYVMVGGPTWNEITPVGGVDGVDAGGGNKKWAWSPVLDTISNNVLFRVSDYNNSNTNIVTASANIIKGQLSVVSPTNTDTWSVGTAYSPSIRWSKTGTIGDLKVEYSTSGTFAALDYTNGYVFTVVNNLSSGVDGNNDYAWQAGVIPSPAARKISDTGKIRITNLNAPAGTELTADSLIFKIRPAFPAPPAFTKPDTTTVWYAMDTAVNQVITWTSISGTKGDTNPPNCFLEYTINGIDYTPVPGAGALNCTHGTNNYTWSPMADLKSNTVKVKVTYTDFTGINTESEAFAVRPKIAVTLNPDGANTKLTVGGNYTNLVQWTYSGDTTARVVEIRYDTNGGGGGSPYPGTQVIATDVAANTGGTGVSWSNVSDIIGSNVRIKVFDKNFTSAAGESPVFKVVGGITLTGPTGGVTKTAATDTDVTWNFKGSIANVDVYYDLDTTNGLQWVLVGTKNQTGCTGSCSYTWTTTNTPAFPVAVGNNYRIKITNALPDTDPLYVESEGTDFKIGAQFDVTSPENGSPVYAEDVSTDITWATTKGSGISKVHLYYSNSDLSASAADPTALGWIRITPAGGVANSSPYNWNPIPRGLTELSTTAHRLLITQADPSNEGDVYNISGGTTFPILGKLMVSTPSTGSESWGVNTNQTIKFKKQGNLQSAEIYYSYDGGVGNYVKIKRSDATTLVDISDATGSPDGQGNYSFSWFLDPATTSLTSGFTGRIKVKAVDPSTQTSVESLPSTAIEVKGSVTLRKPGGVDDPTPAPMDVGTNYLITWDKFGAVNNVQIHYSTTGCGVGANYDANPVIFDGVSTPTNFTWSVPDKIGTNLCIRIRHTQNTNVKDESDAVFRIKGKLLLTEPENSGLSYTVGTQQTIRWTSTGTFSPLELHFDKDGDFVTTTTDTYAVQPLFTVNNCAPPGTYPYECNGTASFNIEDYITGSAKVRIRGTGANSDVEWISTNPFKIVGGLDVTTPDTDPAVSRIVWYVGETNKRIYWDATGTVTNVNIGYKLSAGASCNYTNIVANDNNSGLGHTAGPNDFDWPLVADERTEIAYICMQDYNFPQVTNVAAYAFSIRPKIDVQAFTAPGRIVVGSSGNSIVFTLSGSKTTAVKAFLSRNNGVDNYPEDLTPVAVSVVPGSNTIPWNNVTAPQTNNAKIKIVDADTSFPEVYGLYPSTFMIVGSVTLTDPPVNPPAPKVMVKKGGSYLIKWSRTGDFPNVGIWYSTNGSAGPFDQPINSGNPTPANNVDATHGQFSWTSIANTTSSNVVIRVADYNDSDTKSLSAPIAIQSTLDITQPDGGQVWPVGTAQDVEWLADGQTLNVKLQYATNGGGTAGNWTDISGASNLGNTATATVPQTFSWTIPNAISSSVKVRVVDTADPPVDSVNPGNWNESAAVFKIRADLTILQPNGNADVNLTDKLTYGDPVYPIQWRVVGTVGTVKLMQSIDGAGYTQISGATGLDSSGYTDTPLTKSWNWPIPDNLSSQVKVRVVNEGDTTVLDPSDYNFWIQGKLTFNPALPQGGDTVWYVGDTKTIAWTKAGTIPNVKLQYSKTSNSAGFMDIPGAESVPDPTLSFGWTIPKDIGGTNLIDPSVWIRAVNADGTKPTVEAVSGQIDLRGVLTLDAPVATDKWMVDGTYNIAWTPKGDMGTVKLEYSIDDFTTPLAVLGPANEPATSLPAGGHNVQQTFLWKIPSNISNNAKVRITPNTASEADVKIIPAFKIVGGFNLLTPDGGVGVFYETDGSTAITWERHGNIANAKLQYSTNNFVGTLETWDIAVVPATDLSYPWQPIPDRPSTTVKVRVLDPLTETDPLNVFTLSDMSVSNFEIRGKLEFKSASGDSPLGGEVWMIDESHMLQWTKHGTIPTVKVEYKVGAGSYAYVKNSSGIEATSVNGNTYEWKIPNQKGLNNVIVKVTSLSDLNVFVESSPLTIRGGFTWTNPSASNQVMFVSSTEVLGWTSFGTIPNVDLKFSTGGINGTYNFMQKQAGGDADNIPNCTPVSPALNCASTFNWDIPNQISKVVYVKIEDSTDPDAVAIFGPIKIAGKIYVDEPDNVPQQERWGVGTPQDIRWTMDGTIAGVKIEYSVDDGLNWVDPPIVSSIVGTTLVKAWSIPVNALTTTAKIQISDVDTASGTPPVVSPRFKIVGSFTVAVPTQTGSTAGIVRVTNGLITPAIAPAVISWTTAGNVPLVDVFWSKTGNVGDWTKINSSAIADGGSGGSINNWDVPDQITTTMRIRVQDNADPDTYNDSGLFTVRGDLKITSPVGGEKWGVAGGVPSAYKTISWQRNGSISTVLLSYSENGLGGPWSPIQDPIDLDYVFANNGSFVWDVAGAKSSQARIRVENNIDSSDTRYAKTESDNDFKFMVRFDVTKPDGGETLSAGAAYNPTDGITWNWYGAGATNVKIDLATGVNPLEPCSAVAPASFDKEITASTLNDGKHPWTPNVNWVTPAACLRIYDVTDVDSENRSVNPFIIRSSFLMDSAIGSADLEAGESFLIFWGKQGNIPTVKLEYSPGGNFSTDSRPIDGVDGLVPNMDNCTSDPTKGCYEWTVPDIEDNKDTGIKFRVSDPNDLDANDVSNPFNIIPKFTVTFPNGNADPSLTDKLKVGHRIGDTQTPYTITWTSSSSPARTPSVTLRYSTDGGVGYTNVIGAVVTSSACTTVSTYVHNCSYVWASGNGGVPDAISIQTRVRVEDGSDLVAKGSSGNNVKIVSNFKVNSPNGGAVYEVGDPLSLTWENIGTVNDVEFAYSTASSDFSSAVVFVPSTANSSPYGWTVANAISPSVRIRVKSTTDDGFDISDADFRIRGKLAVTSPTNALKVSIGQPFTVTWTANGDIPNVDILYDTYDGKGYDGIAGNADDYKNLGPDALPNTGDETLNSIADNAPGCTAALTPPYTCNGSFNWPIVPDTATASARIKIFDSRTSPDNTDVIGISPKFNIVGNFTLLEPNGNGDGEDWRVNTPHDIRFNWGGTMPDVNFYYTKNTNPDPEQIPANEWFPCGAGTYDYGPGDGSGGAVRTFSWTIPDDISPTVRVKVAFADDLSVYDVSDDFFKIRGAFTLLTPNGNPVVANTDRWVTYDKKFITWNTDGTINNVKLQYSNDGFVSDIHPIAGGNPIPNTTGSYEWTIDDAVLKDVDGNYTNYNLVQIRVSDANDLGVYDDSDNDFKIDYYMVTWNVYDLLTNAPLSDLSVIEVKSTDLTWVEWQEVGITTSPVRVQPTPYGSWVATWSKTGYGAMGQVVTADQDRSYQLFMETTTVHIWKAATEFSYEPDPDGIGPGTDRLDAISWLERDGSIVPGVTKLDVKIYDGSTLVNDPPILSSTTVDPVSNLVIQSWNGTPLVAGKVYSVVTTAEIGTGGKFNSPSALNITEVKKLADMKATIDAKLDKPLSQVESAVVGAVEAKLDTQTGIIQNKMDLQTAAIQTTLNTFTASVASSIVSLENAAANSLASADKLEDAAILSQDAAQDLQDIARRQAAKLLIPPSVVTGEPALLRYRGYSEGLTPLIDILDFDNNPIVQAIPMTAVDGKPGLYEYAISEINSKTFEPETSITVIVTESATGSVESGSIFIETATGQLLMPRTVLLGDKVIIRFRGRSDWKPKITLQNFEDIKIVDEVAMTKSKDSEDVFEYVITEMKAESYEPGKPVTVTVIEKAAATMESGTFIVESTSLSTLEGLVASGAGVKGVVVDVLDAIKAVEGTLATGGDINIAMQSLREKMDALPKMIEEGVASSPVVEAVNKVQEQFTTFAGKEGYDFSTLLEKGLEGSATVEEIRSKTDEVQGATEVMQKVIEQQLGGEDAPVVHSFFH